MNYSVVIPTNRDFDSIRPLLESFACQTLLPSQIIILLDRNYIIEDYKHYAKKVEKIFYLFSIRLDIVNPLTDSNFVVGKWASYVRNYGTKKVISPYMIFIDDDNTFDEYFCDKLFENWSWNENKSIINHNSIIVPIQYDDKSTYVRQAVADSFNFALCRPHRLTTDLITHSDRYFKLFLSSSNCLAWSTNIFLKFPFIEDVPFVYEDLILTGQLSKSWVGIFCDTRSSVIHSHGQRAKLAELYINTPQRAYYKAKHRIIFVHTIWSMKELIIFYSIWLFWQLWWLVIHILLYAHPQHRFTLILSLIKGTIHGIKIVIRQ